MSRKSGAFTLIEVMIAVAVLGLSAAASLRLLTLSARALEQVRYERSNLSLARTLWLKAASNELEERGRESTYSWETKRFDFDRQDDVPEGFFCRKVIVSPGDPITRPAVREMHDFIFYVPDLKIVKGRRE